MSKAPKAPKANGSSKRRSKKALPAALVERASAMAGAKRSRDQAEAKELIELIRRRQATITESFYDIGEALRTLRDRRLHLALGLRSFAELCEKRLGISDTQAYKLVAIAVQLPRTRALELGQEKAFAFVEQAKATAKSDTAETLASDGVRLPGRRGTVDPKSVSVAELREAAQRERRRSSPKDPAGEIAKEAEAIAARCEAALRKAGLSRAKVRISLFRKKGVPPVAELRITGVPLVQRAALRRALEP